MASIEAFQFVKARISKLHRQYLGGVAFCSDKGCEFIDRHPDIGMVLILKFEQLCLHLDLLLLSTISLYSFEKNK